jgi:hypothetical protein
MVNVQAKDDPVGSSPLLGATAAYAVLVGIGLGVLGTAPAAAETGPQVVAWFREHRDGVRGSVWAFTVATPPFAVMIALLRRLLPAPHRDVFLIGAVSFLVSGAVFMWTLAGLAPPPSRPGARDCPSGARCSGVLWPRSNWHDNDDDGTGHVVGAAGTGGATKMARYSGRGRVRGAGRRDGDDLRLDRLYAAGRRDEFATRGWAYLGLDPGLWGVGWPSWATVESRRVAAPKAANRFTI